MQYWVGFITTASRAALLDLYLSTAEADAVALPGEANE